MFETAARARRWPRCTHAFAVVAVIVAAAPSVHAADPGVQSGEADDAGVHLRWMIRPIDAAGESGFAALDVDVSDGLGGTPLRLDGGRLYAWMQRRRGGLLEAEQSCSDRVRSLTGPGLGQRADIDLNDYRLLTLNTDRTIAVINPFVALSGAKLESIVTLPGEPERWLQIPQRAETWVALRDPPRLVGLDLQSRRLTRTLALPAPVGALAFEPATGRLWMALPDAGSIATLDLASSGAALNQEPAKGVTGLFAAQAGDEAGPSIPGVVSLHEDGAVVLHGPAGDAHWRLDNPPAVAGYSALAHRLLVATRAGTLVWLDPAVADGAVDRRLELGHAVTAMAVFDAGRRALALGDGRGSVVDLAQGFVTARVEPPSDADAIVISERFAFALGKASGRAILWPLADLRGGKSAPIAVQLGRGAPESPAATAALAVPAPDGDGLLMANPTDGVVYRYNEGMMAPSGSFSNYRRAPLGLQIFDPALREATPGHFHATLRYAEGGPYTLILAATSPRVSACAAVQLAPTARHEAAETETLKSVLLGTWLADGADPLRPTVGVRLERRHADQDTATVADVDDLTLLVFDRHSGWQERVALHRDGATRYLAQLNLPHPGRYDLLAASASAGMGYRDGFMGAITLGGAAP